MTSGAKPSGASTRDLGASLIRTFVAVAVGSLLAWLVQEWGWVLDGPTQDGVVEVFTALVIGVYYLCIRWLELRYPAAGWLLGLAKSPTYPATTGPTAAGADTGIVR